MTVTAACRRLCEVTDMNDLPMLPHQKLDAYRLSRELAIGVRAAKITHGELRDQAERPSVSVFLAINEGCLGDRFCISTS